MMGYYLSIRIDRKTTNGVAEAIEQLRQQYGEHFSEVFRSITKDNGSGFADFTTLERYSSEFYFAHPYSAWERPINERTNRLLRRFIPKGESIQNYNDERILIFADEINAFPRNHLGYLTPEELFEILARSNLPNPLLKNFIQMKCSICYCNFPILIFIITDYCTSHFIMVSKTHA